MFLDTAIVFALLLLMVLLPFLPALREWTLRRDNAPIGVDPNYTRDPRFFGRNFRDRLQALLVALPPEAANATKDAVLGAIEVRPELLTPTNSAEEVLVVAQGDGRVAEGGALGDAWIKGNGVLGRRTHARSIACDGTLEIGHDSEVSRWVDTDRGLIAHENVHLGMSASSDGPVTVGNGCTFVRIWGRPVTCERFPDKAQTPSGDFEIEDHVMWGRGTLSLPQDVVVGTSIVAWSDVHVGPRARIGGTVKAHGSIFVEAGARVDGNLIARRDIHLRAGAIVRGHVFAERDLDIGPGCEVGSDAAFKGAQCGRDMRLGSGVIVHGWVVAGRGGVVV